MPTFDCWWGTSKKKTAYSSDSAMRSWTTMTKTWWLNGSSRPMWIPAGARCRSSRRSLRIWKRSGRYREQKAEGSEMNQVGRFMSKRSSLRIPREHGAWAMLYVSFALAVTCVFIAHESLLAWWRSRSRGQENIEARKFAAGYLVLAGVFGAPLLLAYHLYLLAPIALGAVVLLAVKASVAAKKQDRTVSSEMVAIAGLAFT